MNKITSGQIINQINQRDIIIGLEQVAKTAKNESSKVQALVALAKISGLLDESAKVQVRNYNNIMDAITDDLGENTSMAKTGGLHRLPAN